LNIWCALNGPPEKFLRSTGVWASELPKV